MIDICCNAINIHTFKNYKLLVKILKKAGKCKVSHLVLGSRYVYGKEFPEETYIQGVIDDLNEISNGLKLGVTVLRGDLLVGDCFLPGVVKSPDEMSVAGSRYLLTELPGYHIPPFWQDIAAEFSRIGIVTVCAGAERHPYIQKHPEALDEMAEKGMLFTLGSDDIQSSISGYMLQKNLACCVCSFTNKKLSSLTRFYKAYDFVAKQYSAGLAEKLFITNPARIIYNEPDLF